jgi:D-alanine-D-alanine ligase
VYDEPADTALFADLPPDHGREYEDPETIEALLAAIEAAGHEAIPLAFGLDLALRMRDLGPELVFNIAEGVRGRARESIVPAWLDHLGIPYAGSDGLTLAVSLDKGLTKTLAQSCGVRTPPFRRVASVEAAADTDLPFPLFVKPNAEGSNMGLRSSSLVRTRQELTAQVDRVLREYREECLVEVFAPGMELCVGLLGNDDPEVLEIARVCLDEDFFTHDEAPLRHARMICPVDLDAATRDELRDMTRRIFGQIGCRDMARADFMMDAEGNPTFIEINPLPSLSPSKAVFPVQAGASGISYEQLIGRIIDTALRRYREDGDGA